MRFDAWLGVYFLEKRGKTVGLGSFQDFGRIYRKVIANRIFLDHNAVIRVLTALPIAG